MQQMAYSLPNADNLRQAYHAAYGKACEDFRCWDPLDMAVSSGSSWDAGSSSFSVYYASENYNVRFPSGEIISETGGDPAPITAKIVILHYLTRAGGQPLAHRWISFKEIPSAGMIYLEPFNKRVVNYLTGVFGRQPQLLTQAGLSLGGIAVDCGDYGIRLNLLPRLPVTYALWAGDEEFPPRATVLFDATAPFYLPTEDLIVAAGYGVSQLAKAAKDGKGSSASAAT